MILIYTHPKFIQKTGRAENKKPRVYMKQNYAQLTFVTA